MHGDELRHRLGGLVLLTALLCAGLAGRILYLRGHVAALAQSAGIELEVFHQVPGAVNPATAGQVRVPPLKGDTFAEAGTRLGETGLLLEGIGDLRGRVVRQEPAAGRLVRRGTPVKVWLEVSP